MENTQVHGKGIEIKFQPLSIGALITFTAPKSHPIGTQIINPSAHVDLINKDLVQDMILLLDFFSFSFHFTLLF